VTEHARKKDQLLVVEDSSVIRRLLCAYISELEGIEPITAGSLQEAREQLNAAKDRIFCAVLDLNLPDAPNGEVVDLVQSQNIPVIVLTGSVDHALRENMLKKQVIDYVLKNNTTEIEHVAYVVGRLHQNQHTGILVVDDTRMFREYLTELLSRYRYHTHTAANGKEALEVLKAHPDISLVITDYHMPQMNGQELIQAIRRTHRREDRAIIGLSDASHKELSAMLLKSGANDFLSKTFEEEEFYCRVTQNTNMIGYVRQIRDSATRDFLTKAYNRRHLFDVGEKLYANAKRGSIILAAALMDADFFKRINDTFGHQVGDLALKAIANALHKTMRNSDIVARYGGEEFVCLSVIKKVDDATFVFERVRKAVENIELEVEGKKVPITASIGVTTELCGSLDEMLNRADEAVYKAKESGRNRVVCL